MWADKWILNHDNAPSHGPLRAGEFLAKKYITKMDPPSPYSPDLAPCDFRLFGNEKKCPDATKIC
jgi:hypothetical protein